MIEVAGVCMAQTKDAEAAMYWMNKYEKKNLKPVLLQVDAEEYKNMISGRKPEKDLVELPTGPRRRS